MLRPPMLSRRHTRPCLSVCAARITRCLLLAALTCAGSAPCLGGDLSALLTLGPINVTLIDLDLNDGVEPSFRWTQDAWTTEIERESYFWFHGVNRTGAGPQGLIDPLRTQLAGDIVASVPGEPNYAKVLGAAQGMELYVEIAPGATDRDAYSRAHFNLDPTNRFFEPDNYFGSNYTFEVAPNTAAVFSTMMTGVVENTTLDLISHSATVSASLTAGDLLAEEPDGYTNPYGYPWYPYVHDGSGDLGSATDSFYVTSRPSPTEGLAMNSGTRTLSMRYDNAVGSAGRGYFYLEALAVVRTAAVVVPEATTAGLALVAIGASAGNRRRGRADVIAAPTAQTASDGA